MLTKILAASTLVFGLATSAAMAQSVGDRSEIDGASGPYMDDTTIDTGTTGSIYSGDGMGMTANPQAVSNGTVVPCASSPGSMGPDANASVTVNDRYCGK